MTRCWLLLLFLLAWSLPGTARAFPTMLRHGQSACTLCHVDPSGGELLTAFGRWERAQLLPTRWGDTLPPTFDETNRVLRLDPPSWLLMGGSYRHAVIAKFGNVDKTVAPPLQADLFAEVRSGKWGLAGSVGAAKVPAGSPHARMAQVTTNQGPEWNVLSRWHWLSWDPSAAVRVRAGRLNLPFGLRVPEHVLWVRDATQTDYESDQQDGVAVAYNEGMLRAEAMAFLGNLQVNPRAYRQRGVSFLAELRGGDHWTAGISGKESEAEWDLATGEGLPTWRGAFGPFFRWAPWTPFQIQGEADVLTRSRRDLGYTGLLQADWEWLEGVHLLAAGEILDEGLRLRSADGPVADERQPRYGKPTTGAWGTLQWFPLRHFELRMDVIQRYQEALLVMGQVHVSL